MPTVGEYQRRRAELNDEINAKFDEQDAKIAALEEHNDFQDECIMEMSETVYA